LVQKNDEKDAVDEDETEVVYFGDKVYLDDSSLCCTKKTDPFSLSFNV